MVAINESAKWCSKVIRSLIRRFACFYLIAGNKVGLYMLPPHSPFITFRLSEMEFPLWQTQNVPKIWFSKFAKYSRGFNECHRTEKYNFLSPTSCNVRMEIRYRVSKPKAKHWKRKTHAIVPFNKFARRSFCTGFRPNKPFAICFNHFGNIVRRCVTFT